MFLSVLLCEVRSCTFSCNHKGVLFSYKWLWGRNLSTQYVAFGDDRSAFLLIVIHAWPSMLLQAVRCLLMLTVYKWIINLMSIVAKLPRITKKNQKKKKLTYSLLKALIDFVGSETNFHQMLKFVLFSSSSHKRQPASVKQSKLLQLERHISFVKSKTDWCLWPEFSML